MALTTKTPGVYIQEIQTLPASVAQVETAIPAFLGYTTKSGAPTVPTRIKSLVEYEEKFGGPFKAVSLAVSAVVPLEARTVTPTVTNTFFLYEAMQMYFANGGGPCYIISTGLATGSVDEGDYTAPLALLAKEDEPTLIVMPELMRLANTDDEDVANYYVPFQAALQQCNQLKDRFLIMDVYEGTDFALTDSIAEMRTAIGTQYLKYAAAYYPQLNTSLSYRADAIYFASGGGAGAPYETMTLQQVRDLAAADVSDEAGAPAAAAFLASIEVSLKATLEALVITLPPSSTMAGIYAQVDKDRGVWKAPANVSLNAVASPAIKISNADQEDMNVTSSGKSVNAIRTFTGKGVLVWGARTLAGNDNEWRYVPVRRLFITMEESIAKATEFVVFEPNDKNTWVRTRAMIVNYLTGLWRQGALAGAKPEDAFFVNVGLGETMTAQDILEGKLIIEVGVAAVRPAEFIILNFSHKLQES